MAFTIDKNGTGYDDGTTGANGTWYFGRWWGPLDGQPYYGWNWDYPPTDLGPHYDQNGNPIDDKDKWPQQSSLELYNKLHPAAAAPPPAPTPPTGQLPPPQTTTPNPPATPAQPGPPKPLPSVVDNLTPQPAAGQTLATIFDKNKDVKPADVGAPPQYTGGADPFKTVHFQGLTPDGQKVGQTITITQNGAVVRQVAGQSAYRMGWVDPSSGYDLSTYRSGKTAATGNPAGGTALPATPPGPNDYGGPQWTPPDRDQIVPGQSSSQATRSMAVVTPPSSADYGGANWTPPDRDQIIPGQSASTGTRSLAVSTPPLATDYGGSRWTPPDRDQIAPQPSAGSRSMAVSTPSTPAPSPSPNDVGGSAWTPPDRDQIVPSQPASGTRSMAVSPPPSPTSYGRSAWTPADREPLNPPPSPAPDNMVVPGPAPTPPPADVVKPGDLASMLFDPNPPGNKVL